MLKRKQFLHLLLEVSYRNYCRYVQVHSLTCKHKPKLLLLCNVELIFI